MVLSLMTFLLKQKLLKKQAMSLLILSGCGIGYLSFLEKLINTLPKTKNYCAELKRYVAYLADVDDEPVFYSTNGLEIVARKEINTFRYICKLILEEKGLNDKKINIILGE